MKSAYMKFFLKNWTTSNANTTNCKLDSPKLTVIRL